MESWFLGRGRSARVVFGFDDVSLVPGTVTIDPKDVDVSTAIGNVSLSIPILGAAMDGVIDPTMAKELGKWGGLGVLNLEGLFTRYIDPYALIEELIAKPREEVASFLQKLYREPIKEELVARCIQDIKSRGVLAAGSVTPARVETIGNMALEAGLDVLVIQSTVTTLRYFSSTMRELDLQDFCRRSMVPVVVGNCATYEVALELMRAGAAGILVGHWSRCCLYHPCGTGHWCSPDHGHRGCGLCSRRLLQGHRTLCSRHHRRGDAGRWRHR